MCGICGVYSVDPPPVRERLVKMRESIVHRGPDDCGMFMRDGIGLAMRRLSVIDLETGKQPMTNEEESLILVFNGEIYNYLELKQNALKKQHRFKTKSDTEVIVHLFEDYGIDCVNHLNGMFAFALLDTKNKSLFLARDPFGIKQLYYAFDGSSFIFASEIKSIFTYTQNKPELDVTGLYDYLSLQYVLGDKTLFKGISKLLPGHYLVLKDGQPQIHQYWDVSPDYDFTRSEGDFAEELGSLLEDSVRLQLRSDVPLGAHLSGGIDTDAITSFASGMLEQKMTTFTAGFAEGGIYDDKDWAEKTSGYCNTDHMITYPTSRDFQRVFNRIMWHLDEPVAAPGIFPQYCVSELAKNNVTVVLGGQGSDEILGGYTRYLIIYLEQALKKTITGSPYDLHIPLEDLLPNLSQLKTYRPLMSYYFQDDLFGDPDARYYRLILRNERISELLTPELQKLSGGYSTFDTFRDIFNKFTDFELLNKILYFEMKAWLPALLQVEDRMSMAWSLESRVPFLDTRVAKLAFSMPSNIKFKGGITKYILRKTLENKLPEEIVWRKDKLGFPVPLKSWFQGDLKPFIEDVLLNKRSLERSIFRKYIIQNVIQNNDEFDRTLWGLLCMETWFSVFLDGKNFFPD